MESNQDIENINQTIQKLVQEKQKRGDGFSEDDEEQLLLSRLLSQVESLKGDEKLQKSLDREEDETLKQGKAEAKNEDASQGGGDTAKITMEEIAKDLKKVKRQNTITHWLLSAMIVLTVTWQLSEVSMILKVKNGMSHPFRSFGTMLTGMLRRPGDRTNGENGEDAEKWIHNNHVEAPHLDIPALNMPELSHLEFPELGFNAEKH